MRILLQKARDALLDADDTKITVNGLKGMSPGDRISDPDRTNLVFLKTKNKGVRAVYRYLDETGKRRDHTIGFWDGDKSDTMFLADIFEEHTRLHAAYNASGEDHRMPHEIRAEDEAKAEAGRAARAAERAEEAKAITVAEMIDRFIEEYSKPYKRSWNDDRKLLAGFRKSCGEKKAHDVELTDITDLMDAAVERGRQAEIARQEDDPEHEVRADKGARQANKIRGAISKCYDFALTIQKGKPKIGQPENRESWLPAGSENPVEKYNIQEKATDPQQFVPDAVQLKKWRRIMQEQEDDPRAKAMLFQVLTFSRINEACGARWEQFDFGLQDDDGHRAAVMSFPCGRRWRDDTGRASEDVGRAGSARGLERQGYGQGLVHHR